MTNTVLLIILLALLVILVVAGNYLAYRECKTPYAKLVVKINNLEGKTTYQVRYDPEIESYTGVVHYCGKKEFPSLEEATECYVRLMAAKSKITYKDIE